MTFIGLDNFQALNETHGRSFGDEVLRGTASRLLGAFPSLDSDTAPTPAIVHLRGRVRAAVRRRVESG